MKNLKKKKGFTLIELIIVIAIIGILAAIAVPKFGNIQADSKKKADVATAKVIADTASVLIAKNDTTTVALLSGSYYPLGAAGCASIVSNLQTGTAAANKPKTATYNRFVVNVDASGNVKVYVITADADTVLTGEPPVQLYPTTDPSFK